MEKNCKTCGRSDRETHLFIHNVRKNGTKVYRCTECNTKYCRAYRGTENGMKKVREAVYRSIQKNIYKQKARIYLNNHIKLMKIQRPMICDSCGRGGKTEAHHKDYKKALDVLWLCKNCHSSIHREL